MRGKGEDVSEKRERRMMRDEGDRRGGRRKQILYRVRSIIRAEMEGRL